MPDLSHIPTSPGVYIYRNSDKEIIYVGKAINLKKRVTQYFKRDDALGEKTTALVSQISSIETRTVDSEIAALILEASLIKKYRPKFNSLLKDDRSYLYIAITKDKFPLVIPAFKSKLTGTEIVYGPFPSGSSVRYLLKTIRGIFPYYSKLHPKKECLYCHLHLCPGPTPDPKIYRHNIRQIKKLLNGKFNSIIRHLVKDMELASKNSEFEKAIVYRSQIDALKYVTTGWQNLAKLYQTVNLPEDNQSSAIQELTTTLNPYLTLPKLTRIECFDISQLGHKYFVGSMVVWQNGHIDHSQYRKFKIPYRSSPDDQLMIKEIIFRRLNHPEWTFPDLIVVDGGKPQVSAANSVTLIPVIGLAKKFETIIIKNDESFQEISLPKNSNALNLLRALRDEAHRFANRYRKSLMAKSINES